MRAVENLLRTFAREDRLFSTGAEVVNFADELYNVTGSTPDPPAVPGFEHLSWKMLLIEMAGIDRDANCYVTNNVPASNTSHPLFRVGVHMTPNNNGQVDSGGVCFLMPLCSWHNSTARNGIAFEHTETKMLKLTGFLKDDLPVTFRLRQPSPDPFAVLFFDEHEQQWKSQNLPTDDSSMIEAATMNLRKKPSGLTVLFERSEDGIYVKRTSIDLKKK